MEADGKSMTPSVSVVICTYNHARFLHKSLQSVFAQGWPDDAYEVIVIDDGSTDATPKIMRRWVRDRGVKYIRKENGGHLSSFNRGIAEATGEYIVLHDGDDMLRPRMIGPRIELMERDPEIGLVHGDLRVVDVRGNVLVPSLFEAYRFEQLDGDLLPQLVWRNVVSSGGTVFRASLREQCHPIPLWAGHAQDWWIAAAIAQVARIGCVREAVTDYRKHDANLNLGSSGEKLAKLVRSELPFRRHLLSGSHTARVPAQALLRGLDLLDDIVLRLMAQGDERADLTPVDDGQRAAAAERRALGLAALAAGDDEAAARRFAGALALDPWDTTSRRELSALRRRRGWLENAPARPHALGPSPAERPHEARGFVVAADGAELAHEPRLLAGYARQFSAQDDATLAIRVTEDGLGDLAAAVSLAGLDTPAAPDLLAITSGAPAAADAVLAAQPPRHGAPVWADGQGIAGLRAWQARRPAGRVPSASPSRSTCRTGRRPPTSARRGSRASSSATCTASATRAPS